MKAEIKEVVTLSDNRTNEHTFFMRIDHHHDRDMYIKYKDNVRHQDNRLGLFINHNQFSILTECDYKFMFNSLLHMSYTSSMVKRFINIRLQYSKKVKNEKINT